MNWTSLRRTLGLVAIAGGLSVACIVVSPLDEVQSASSTGGGAGTSTGGSGGAAGAATGGMAGTAPSCQTHVECSQTLGGVPARCVQGQCVELLTKDCRCLPNVPDEEWSDQESILIGGFAPLGSGDDCEDVATINYRHALDEINGVNNQGLPGANGRRRIALLLCDNQPVLDPAVAKQRVLASFQHLIEVARVPAVLAFVDPGHLITAFDDYGRKNGVFFLTPNGTTESFAIDQDQDLVWHMLGLPKDVAPTYQELLEKLEAVVPAIMAPEFTGSPDAGAASDGGSPEAGTGDGGASTPLRVVMLYNDSNAFSKELKTALQTQLRFNGANTTWVQNVNNGHAAAYPVSLTIDSAKSTATLIATFRPHVVLSTVGSEAVGVGFYTDQSWWPYYVLSPLNRSDAPGFIEWIKASKSIPNVYERFIIVNVASTEDSDLLSTYDEALGNKFGKGTPRAENLYDSVYFLVYALFAAGKLERPTGNEIGVEGMPSLTSGTEYKVGAGDFASVLGALTPIGGKVSLLGTLGPPTFDLQTGLRRNTGQLDCFTTLGFTDLQVTEHVGHMDEKTGVLRAHKDYAVKNLPCLKWLNLPIPPPPSP